MHHLRSTDFCLCFSHIQVKWADVTNTYFRFIVWRFVEQYTDYAHPLPTGNYSVVSKWQVINMTEWKKPTRYGVAFINLKPSEYINVTAGHVLSLQYKGGPNPIPYTNTSRDNYCKKSPIMSFKNSSFTSFTPGQTNTFVLDFNIGCRVYSYQAILTVWSKSPEKSKLSC